MRKTRRRNRSSSARRDAEATRANPRAPDPRICSVADVRHESHETSSFHGRRDRVLANGGTTGLATADDFALTTGQFLEKFDVFIVDEHRSRSLAVDRQRILFLSANLRLGTLAIDAILLKCSGLCHISTSFSLPASTSANKRCRNAALANARQSAVPFSSIARREADHNAKRSDGGDVARKKSRV